MPQEFDNFAGRRLAPFTGRCNAMWWSALNGEGIPAIQPAGTSAVEAAARVDRCSACPRSGRWPSSRSQIPGDCSGLLGEIFRRRNYGAAGSNRGPILAVSLIEAAAASAQFREREGQFHAVDACPAGGRARLLAVLAAGCSAASAHHPLARAHTPVPPTAVASHSAAPAQPQMARKPSARHYHPRHRLHPPPPPAPPAMTPPPAPPPTMNPIPQGNGGDQDADNNGGPSDGDGNI